MVNTIIHRIASSILGAEKPPPLAVPTGTGVTEAGDLGGFIAGIINWSLGLLGIVFLVLLLFAGFQYATAGGDESKTKDALALIRNAVIGIIIIGFSFVLANTVLSAFLTNPGAGTTTDGRPSYDACMSQCIASNGGATCNTAYYRCVCGGGGASCNDLR